MEPEGNNFFEDDVHYRTLYAQNAEIEITQENVFINDIGIEHDANLMCLSHERAIKMFQRAIVLIEFMQALGRANKNELP